MKTGVDLITEERARQIEKEGFGPDHDFHHTDGQMAKAAAVYVLGTCLGKADRSVMDEFGAEGAPYMVKRLWPFDMYWFKPKNKIRDLVRAGALIAAEIDRLQRAD